MTISTALPKLLPVGVTVYVTDVNCNDYGEQRIITDRFRQKGIAMYRLRSTTDGAVRPSRATTEVTAWLAVTAADRLQLERAALHSQALAEEHRRAHEAKKLTEREALVVKLRAERAFYQAVKLTSESDKPTGRGAVYMLRTNNQSAGRVDFRLQHDAWGSVILPLVNWSSWGEKSPDEARAYARAILHAADLAECLLEEVHHDIPTHNGLVATPPMECDA